MSKDIDRMYDYLSDHNYISYHPKKDPFRQSELHFDRAMCIVNKHKSLVSDLEKQIFQLQQKLDKALQQSKFIDELIEKYEEEFKILGQDGFGDDFQKYGEWLTTEKIIQDLKNLKGVKECQDIK